MLGDISLVKVHSDFGSWLGYMPSDCEAVEPFMACDPSYFGGHLVFLMDGPSRQCPSPIIALQFYWMIGLPINGKFEMSALSLSVGFSKAR